MVNCAFSGHRILSADFDVNLLDRVILNLIKSGVKNFYCGMAVGFDIVAAESVLKYKKDYGISLYACLPCENQSERFSEASKTRYERALEGCDGVIILSTEYYNGCMQARNRFLIDNTDVLVCYLRKKTGGTYYTVNYAKEKGLKVIEV